MPASTAPAAIPAAFLMGWPRGERALLMRLGKSLSEKSMLEIAGGDPDAAPECHIPALDRICAEGTLPDPFGYGFWLALRLSHYVEPDWEGSSGADRARRRVDWHRGRAFCSAIEIACHALHPSSSATEDPVAALLRLLASLNEADMDVDGEASAFLAWLAGRMSAEPGGAVHAYVGIALLRFALVDEWRTDADILALIDWIAASGDAHDAWLRDRYGVTRVGRWPSGHVAEAEREGWAAYASTMAAGRCNGRSPGVAEGVSLIAGALEA